MIRSSARVVQLAAIQDGLLQQREERLHGGVVAGRGDLAHGSDQVVTAQCGQELPGPELAAPVAVHDASGHVSTADPAAGNGGAECVHGQGRLHSVADGVPHDPVRVHVLDRAQVDLALVGSVLGDVRQPQRVRRAGGEVAVDQVVVRGRGRASCRSCRASSRTRSTSRLRRTAARSCGRTPGGRPRGPRRPAAGTRTPGRRGGRRTGCWPDAPARAHAASRVR